MSIEQKVGQLIITGISGESLSPESCKEIQRIHPAGITFQWYNVVDPDQMTAFIDAIRECSAQTSPAPLFYTLAHEGEYVYRFDRTVTMFPAALAVAAAGDPQLAYQIGSAAGQELSASGLNMVLAPVADVLLELDSEVISQRTFGSDTGSVSRYVQNMVAGYHEAGIITVLKHFPGHGGVEGDTHKLLPVDDTPLSEIRQLYLPPFQAGIDAGAEVIMLSHVAYPGISGDNQPATISPPIFDLLRNEMGFSGPILSDHLRMKAVSGGDLSVAGASLAAVKAGIDLLLLNEPEDAARSYGYLLEAAKNGALSEERLDDAVRRVLTLKASAGLLEPRSSEPEINWQKHQDLAYQVGLRAVTLYRNEAGLVPIPVDKKRVYVVGPIAEESEALYARIEQELIGAGFDVSRDHLTLGDKGIATTQGQIDAIVTEAAKHDLVLYLTYQAHLLKITRGDTWQADLGRRLLTSGRPVIFVALRSPTDLLEYQEAKTFLATFGTTPGQIDGLLGILIRGQEPMGINPLPELK